MYMQTAAESRPHDSARAALGMLPGWEHYECMYNMPDDKYVGEREDCWGYVVIPTALRRLILYNNN